jgi:hypothetical protein
MATLPSSSSPLALHLSDRALTPIISSSHGPASNNSAQLRSQAEALSSLTTTAITAYEIASRLGLGAPERIMIETSSSGPIIFHSYLSTESLQRPRSRRTPSGGSVRRIVEQAREGMQPLMVTTDNDTGCWGNSDNVVNGLGHIEALEDAVHDGSEDATQTLPLLIVSVVAPSAAEVGDARRTAARLERTGREFQREWSKGQEQATGSVGSEDGEDG